MASDPPFKEGGVFLRGPAFEWRSRQWRREAKRRHRNERRRFRRAQGDWEYYRTLVRPAVDAHFAGESGFHSVTILEDPDDWLPFRGFKVVDVDRFVDAFTNDKAG